MMTTTTQSARPTFPRAVRSAAMLVAAAVVPALAGAQGNPHAGHGAPVQQAGKKAPSAFAAFTKLVGTNVVAVTTHDYAFDMPTTLPAGRTTFVVTNAGKEMHHVYLVKLDAGKTMQDFFKAMEGPPKWPAWAHPVGGPNSPRPMGGESNGTVELQPGKYIAVCMIPAPDGQPHVMKGMAKEITVTGTAKPVAAPKVDATITLADYGFTFSTPLKSGKQTIAVRNAAAQPHEVFIARLAPGKTVDDLLAWIEKMDGPPPAEPIGGTTDIASKGVNYLQLDLAAGEYALICFSPDQKDFKPHFMHGMKKQISVK